MVTPLSNRLQQLYRAFTPTGVRSNGLKAKTADDLAATCQQA